MNPYLSSVILTWCGRPRASAAPAVGVAVLSPSAALPVPEQKALPGLQHKGNTDS